MFSIHSIDTGTSLPVEYLPAQEELKPTVGVVLSLTDDMLVASSEGNREYLCIAERATPCIAGENIPVVRIRGDIVFETVVEGETVPKMGQKVALNANATGVTGAEAENGEFEITWVEEQTDRVIVRGRFVA